jgi:hypothetical protein
MDKVADEACLVPTNHDGFVGTHNGASTANKNFVHATLRRYRQALFLQRYSHFVKEPQRLALLYKAIMRCSGE